MTPRRADQQALDLGGIPDPGPGQRTNSIGHPVEGLLRASARDICDALENGFRARADLKGKLAELFMSRHLDELHRQGVIADYSWTDKDGQPDFILTLANRRTRTLEVKNVRSGTGYLRIETQKTRGAPTDPWSRPYRVSAFDFVAPCMFNRTGRWEYLFARSVDLARHPLNDDYLATFQAVPLEPDDIWRRDLIDILG